VIHRTFRSLDQAPKLVGFTIRQWCALIAGASVVLGLVFLAHLPTKPAITLCVFVVGLPAALTYVSESGGLQLGALLRDMCRWRVGRHRLPATPRDYAGARGLMILEPADFHLADNHLADGHLSDPTLEELLSEERWGI
jgi:PrgI family protein